ncbi:MULTISPECIES: aldehyde dehydrogenase family protein [Pseudomonas]|jgi:betaine-aldehyde dehydrogenase|uniref:Aldehyde dehydrogenase n=1 Tax=Pseudomonas citronellolis TaxID=53408 RepID=A0A127MTE9_9PSED|nr:MULTISPECIES: aldehyde dehydrogenase family protein [Pseudomonas]AMO76592.1 Betaine aldehyde dehydrogenase [Pseudomonas citronellolis]ANI15315.1 aldehyde dehydrogenase [Pseudomonas citronellolis]KES21107.1 aldehyde dehydrogenase [Pseudomonas sp. AAC]MBH3435623.1 aldehyde dehydrogenase family protein [Pseudomonas citronellolis]OHR84001.1 aldehyde dehydrogenase [Pseudomonas sp. HMSC75E02]
MQNLNFINGRWCQSLSGETLPVTDPASEENFAEIPRSGAAEVDAAVQAAEAALAAGWRRTTGAQRARLLRAIAAGIQQQAGALAELEVRDCGKPITEARYDMSDAVACFEYYAGLAEALDGQQGTPVEVSDPRFEVKLRHEPAGVVGLIVPWNFPLVNAAWKVAPALAAGCTVVLKPSELASLTTLRLARIAEEAGLPAGVLNVVCGLGSECGAAVAAHPGIAKVSFTGGTESGRKVMQARANLIGDLALELGGKSAMIVFDDVDLDHAVEWILMGSMYNQGQVCAATSRVLVQDSIFDALLEKLRHAVQGLRVGAGLDDSTQVGPLISAAQRERVAALVRQGVEQGARLLCGGEAPGQLDKGYFYLPTVALDVSRDNVLWREEVFGPVLCVARFGNEAQAIELANDSRYGLAAAVLSDDGERRERVAAQLVAGIVWANCSGPAFIQAPWGGVKQSGFRRGLGEWGMHEFLELKQVTTYTSADAWGHFNAR